MNNNIDNNGSEGAWSFRDKGNIKKIEINLIDKITQKVNQSLIKCTQKKNKNKSLIFKKNHYADNIFIDVFRKNAEKELEIFESERNSEFSKKNKKPLINIDSTLSDLSLGKGIFVTKDDLILNLPSSFLKKTKCDDIGNTYLINVSEINRLIPNDEFISKLHIYYSKNDNNH